MPFLAGARSVNYPQRAWLSELWAPVGLRYHALHHLQPGLPSFPPPPPPPPPLLPSPSPLLLRASPSSQVLPVRPDY